MVQTLERDIREINRALSGNDEEVSLSLSRNTVEFVAYVIGAKAQGKEVIIAQTGQYVTPTDAAVILGVSRPQVRKIMDSGRLPFHMVGTHHRIALSDIKAFQEAERVRRKEAFERFAAIENELGLLQ